MRKSANPRTERIAQQIHRELADLIRLGLKDPRVGLVTLTDVEVTRDYSHAKVFYTLLGDVGQRQEVHAVLERASGFLRGELGRRIKMYSIPQVHFVYDESVERGTSLSRLIDEAVKDLPPVDGTESGSEPD